MRALAWEATDLVICGKWVNIRYIDQKNAYHAIKPQYTAHGILKTLILFIFQ